VEIADSARKHGIEDDDIRHALRLPLRMVTQDPSKLLVIGPARDARLLEVVVLDPDTDPSVIHADILRPKFFDYLR
jgi:hypothetical protein